MTDLDLVVKYSCFACGLHCVTCRVPARGVKEDVVDWMRKVVSPHLVRDHEARSPECRPKTLSEVMIPMTGTDRIGGPVEN